VIDLRSLDLGHPLSYVVVFGLALIDGVFPLVPTRTAVIALGVIAGTGDRRAYPLLVLATAGAFVSDNVSYCLMGLYLPGLVVEWGLSRRRDEHCARQTFEVYA
jgi:membrane protein DedA with SNARE-associated domain